MSPFSSSNLQGTHRHVFEAMRGGGVVWSGEGGGLARHPPPLLRLSTHSTRAIMYLQQWGGGVCPARYFCIKYPDFNPRIPL